MQMGQRKSDLGELLYHSVCLTKTLQKKNKNLSSFKFFLYLHCFSYFLFVCPEIEHDIYFSGQYDLMAIPL